MQETPQQYIKRILSHQQGKKPMAILSSTPRKIAKLLRGVPKTRLRTRPGPGKWSVAMILAHLADAEMVTGFRMRLILGSNGTPIQAFDQDVWAAYSRYEMHDPRLSFEVYRAMRERNVRLLGSLSAKMWNYYGMHAERGKETITRMTEMAAGHDINHLRQIAGLVRARKDSSSA